MNEHPVDYNIKEFGQLWRICAKTNLTDDTYQGAIIEFVATVAQHGSNWRAQCSLLHIDRCYPTAALAIGAVIGFMDEFIHFEYPAVSQIEIWRNSGGYMCVGGNYRGWSLYVCQPPYGGKWSARATKGNIQLSATEERLQATFESILDHVDALMPGTMSLHLNFPEAS